MSSRPDLSPADPRAVLPTGAGRVRERLGALRRAVLRRRRPLAALSAAVAVAAVLVATTAPPPATVAVRVAARDLPAGATLGAGDLVTARFAPGTEPPGLVGSPEGRVLAAPLGRGEPVTRGRLVGASLTEGRPGVTALPVRLPDPGMVGLLEPGDVIDLVAADPQAGVDAVPAETVARDVPVLALPADDSTGGGGVGGAGLPGRLVVLGVADVDVPAVAAAAALRYVTYAWSDH